MFDKVNKQYVNSQIGATRKLEDNYKDDDYPWAQLIKKHSAINRSTLKL
jgi:hypothetical protein